jgi:hypothetical protein
MSDAVAIQWTASAAVVVPINVVADGHDEFLDVAEDAAPERCCVRSRKDRSTMLSQELLVGVK